MKAYARFFFFAIFLLCLRAPFAATGQAGCVELRAALSAAEKQFASGNYAAAARGFSELISPSGREACRATGLRAVSRLAEVRYRQARFAESRAAALAALAAFDTQRDEAARSCVVRACVAGAKASRTLSDNLPAADSLAINALRLSTGYGEDTPPEIHMLAAAAAARRSFDLGDFSGPRSLIVEIKDLIAAHGDNDAPGYAEALFYACDVVGDYYYYNHFGQKALHYKRQALERLSTLNQRYAAELRAALATEVSLDMARLHRMNRQFDAGVSILDRLSADSASLSRRELQALHSEYGRIYGRLNMLRDPKLQFPSAASGGAPDGPLWQKALNHAMRARELAEPDGDSELEVCYNLAILHYYAFKYEKALSFIRQAVPQGQEKARDRSYVLLHGLAATLLNELGRFDEALEAVQTAIVCNTPAFSNADQDANPSLNELPFFPMLQHNLLCVKFDALFGAGRQQQAVAMLDVIERFTEHLLGERTYATDRMHVKEQLSNCYNLAAHYYAVETGDIWNGFYYADKSRAVDFGPRRRAGAPGEATRLRRLQKEYETLILLEQSERTSAALARKSFALEYELDRCKTGETTRAGAADDFSPLEFRARMEAYVSARPEKAVVAYLAGNSRKELLAFALDDKGLRLFRLAGGFDSLLNTIGKFNRAIDSFYYYRANPYGYGGARGSGAFEQYIAAGQKLTTWLLPPIEDARLAGKELVISPHGPLWALSWTALAALPDTAELRFSPSAWYDRWGEQVFGRLEYPLADRNIVLAYSLSALETAQLKPHAGPFAAFAPVFDNKTELNGTYFASRTSFLRQMEGLRNLRRGPEGALRLVPLPHTREEAAELQRAARKAGRPGSVALRKAATKTRFEQAVREGCSILHLATHAFYNPGASLLSGVVFSPEPGDSLYGGVLYPAEIDKLNLAAADLVTLSACQTSLGPIRKSEGQTGLARAFLQAGARNVLSSLWSVNDEATAEYMKEFYKGVFGQNLGYAEAMSRARAATMRAGFAAPYYWAGFRLVGR